MSRKYKASPLIEALCELVFEPTQSWDLTIPGLLYESVKQDYPIKEEQNLFGIEVQIGKGAIGGYRDAPTIPKMIFRTADRSGLLQVSPNTFAINTLPPYGGWTVFRETIAKNVEAYRTVVAERNIAAINLRYINRVKIDAKVFDLLEYFRILPQIPINGDDKMLAFLMTAQISSEAPKGVLTVVNAAENPENGSSFIFDFLLTSRAGDCPRTEEFIGWLDAAHKKVSTAFDTAFTEKAHKELFKEVTI